VLLFCSTAAFAHSAEQSSPAPSPSPTPSLPADPCGSILSIVSRPAISTTVCTVRPHHFEAESGWNNTTTTGPGGGNLGTYGVGAIRFGTGDSQYELIVLPPTKYPSRTGEPISNTWGDSGLGIRDELGYTSDWLWGVNGVVTVPTGSRQYTAGGTQFTGNFNWAYTINSVLGLGGTFGFNQLRGYNASDVSQPYFAFIPSLEATATLPGPSQLFAEYVHYSQAGIGLGSKTLFDYGYSHVFGPHLLFDIEYGESPTLLGRQRQHYIGAGMSFMN
jgi:hypothetical protein